MKAITLPRFVCDLVWIIYIMGVYLQLHLWYHSQFFPLFVALVWSSGMKKQWLVLIVLDILNLRLIQRTHTSIRLMFQFLYKVCLFGCCRYWGLTWRISWATYSRLHESLLNLENQIKKVAAATAVIQQQMTGRFALDSFHRLYSSTLHHKGCSWRHVGQCLALHVSLDAM